MLPLLATVDRLQERVATTGGTISDESAVTLLARASTLVRAITGRSWTDPDDPDTLETFDADVNDLIWDTLQTVVVDIAERGSTTNSEGVTQESLLSYSVTYRDSGVVTATDDDKVMLAAVVNWAQVNRTADREVGRRYIGSARLYPALAPDTWRVWP